MTSKRPNKIRRTITEDEKTLWEVFTRDVKPLRNKKHKGSDDDMAASDDEIHTSDTAITLPDNLGDKLEQSEQSRAARNLPSARHADRGPQIKNRALARSDAHFDSWQ